MKVRYAVITVLLAIFIAGCNVNNSPVASSPIAGNTVEWCITPNKSPEPICATDNVSTGETAEKSLMDVDAASDKISIEFSEAAGLGKYISTVNGYTADKDLEYWKFIINGTESQVGISSYQVKPGDKLELILVGF